MLLNRIPGLQIFLPENGAGQGAVMESGLAADDNCHKNFHDISGA
jgi:hypothetical protein